VQTHAPRLSSRNGLYAAVLAAGGYTGIKRVFERDYGGFLSTFGEGHSRDASQIAADLGGRWETLRIVVKPYAAMGGLHSPLDALFEIDAQRKLRADDIERIEVDLSHAVYHHCWWELERPVTPIGAQMNVAYALAVAVIDGAAMVQQFTPQRINRDDVWSLIPRVKVRHDQEFDKLGPAAGARHAFALRSGRLAARVLPCGVACGIAAAVQREIVTKFRTLTDGLIARARQSEIERVVRLLDTCPTSPN
jgi:2-methylcitrate dehydratase PrpD